MSHNTDQSVSITEQKVNSFSDEKLSGSEKELIIVNKILQNQRLMKLVKFSLSNLIQKLIDELGFDKSSFFSNNVHRFGNIGHCDDEADLRIKFEYILSPESTIREKVSAITNSIVNGSDTLRKNRKNTKLLYDFIMMRKVTSLVTPKGSWIHKRAEQIEQFTTDGLLVGTDQSHWWAPIYLLYSGYRTKYDRTKAWLNGPDKFDSTSDGVTEQDLSEPLSVQEKRFLKIGNDLETKRKPLPMMTGKFIYKDVIPLIPEFVSRDRSLIIGGISGHTILLLELALIVNVKWIPILFACIITQTPHHHSIAEIIDALREMELLGQSDTESSTNDARYIDVLHNLAKNIDIYL